MSPIACILFWLWTEVASIVGIAFKQEFNQTFRSLQHRQFRIYFAGQAISLCGTWMQNVALSWLIYRLTKSSVALGAVECANLLPMLILGLVGGSVADRFDRRKVLLLTQSLAMLQATVLSILTFTNHLEVWHAVALAALLGTLSAFEVPSRQAFIVQLVEKENLVNAISLNSSLFNGARAFGPMLAAGVVCMWGEGACFLANTVSFMAALLAIASIRVPADRITKKSEQAVRVSDAIEFVRTNPAARRVVALAMIMSLFGMQYSVLMPIFASEILHGDIRTLGLLRAVAGCGSLLAALALASRASGEFLKRAIGFASVSFGTGLLFFSLSQSLLISCLLAFVVGLSMTTQLSGGHSIMQLAVNDQLRGRVMSIYMMVVLGFAPLGSLMVGYAARTWGAAPTVACCAICCMVAGIVYSISGEPKLSIGGCEESESGA